MADSEKGWGRKLVGVLSAVFLTVVAAFFGLLILLLVTQLTVPSYHVRENWKNMMKES